jgi:hypothetical protein
MRHPEFVGAIRPFGRLVLGLLLGPAKGMQHLWPEPGRKFTAHHSIFFGPLIFGTSVGAKYHINHWQMHGVVGVAIIRILSMVPVVELGGQSGI